MLGKGENMGRREADDSRCGSMMVMVIILKGHYCGYSSSG